jgi:hypothetical protein
MVIRGIGILVVARVVEIPMVARVVEIPMVARLVEILEVARVGYLSNGCGGQHEVVVVDPHHWYVLTLHL